jgi:hypothetical protein
MSIRRFTLSPLLVVAVGALVVGLAAPASIAEASHLINGKSIKNHTITGKKLKNNTVTGRQIKESTLGTVRKAARAKTLPPLVWHPLILQNNWVSFNANFGTPSYAVDAEGFVHLKGAIKNGTINSIAFVLPAAAHPAFSQQLPVDQNLGTTGRLFIDTEGGAKPSDDPASSGSAATFTSLDGVEFAVS